MRFGFGVIGADQPHPDSSKAEREVRLTDAWKQYTIDVEGKNLSRIKTGFMWVVDGQGRSVTFYLDDIQYE